MSLGDKQRERRRVAELATWQAERDRVQSFITRAQSFAGATNAEVPTLPLQLPEGERALLVLPGVQLIEPPRLPGHFMGGTGGFTFHVVRATRGHAIGGDEEPTSIDTGVVTVTDRRAVFSGSLHTRTWDYTMVIGYHTNAHPPWTAIAVSDRQRISGVRYDAVHAEEFRFALALGMARCHESVTSLVDDLHRQLDELDRERPGGIGAFDVTVASPGPMAAMTTVVSGADPTTTPSMSRALSTPTTTSGSATAQSGFPPPGWYPDPYRTARLRWWDGRAWTGHNAP